MTSTAYLLISHGSRDPRHQAAINRLAQLVRERLNPSLSNPWSAQPAMTRLVEGHASRGMSRQEHPRQQKSVGGVVTASIVSKTAASAPNRLPQEHFMVGTAVLDYGLLPLHKQICEFGRRLSSSGIEQLQLVPLFLLRGKHVMDDIPTELELARTELNGTIELAIGEHIGGDRGMADVIAKRFIDSPKAGRLMAAHGSRRARGNRPVDALAKSVGTAVAYWTTESDIENQIIQLMQQGCSTLTIFPYFLFPGGITDAIAHLIEELAERFPRTEFRLLPPLGATVDVADLVVAGLDHRSEAYRTPLT